MAKAVITITDIEDGKIQVEASPDFASMPEIIVGRGLSPAEEIAMHLGIIILQLCQASDKKKFLDRIRLIN